MQMRIEPLNRIIALGFFLQIEKSGFVFSDAQLWYACYCEKFFFLIPIRSVRKLNKRMNFLPYQGLPLFFCKSGNQNCFLVVSTNFKLG